MRHTITTWLLILLALAGCSDDANQVLQRDRSPGDADSVERASDTVTGDGSLDAFPPFDEASPTDLLDVAPDLHADTGLDADDGSALTDADSDQAPETTLDAMEVSDVEEDVFDPATLIVPCSDQDDCGATGICLDNGTGESWCLPWCATDADCPAAYSCAPPAGLSDTACLPLQAATQCKPCAQDSDCDTPDYAVDVTCVQLEESGSFCARSCTPDGFLDCPYGFECLDLGEGGEEQFRCLPKEGKKCFCSDYMEGLTTQCSYTNFWGSCSGVRACLGGNLSACSSAIPKPEECNGEDDDCDGLVDEGLQNLGLTCLIDYEMGTCEFDQFCANGKWNCPEVEFEDICAADQNSCFWFGSVLDTDDDYDPDFCDPDDDNDGFLDEEDCRPTDAGSYPGAPELCDGFDGDCNGVSDFDQLTQENCESSGAWGTCQGTGYCVNGAWECQPGPPEPESCPTPEQDCTWFPVPDKIDFDKDGIPDFCDTDDDNDGVQDEVDNCLELFNPGQLDLDEDGEGDACDKDDDGDGYFDEFDCCPYFYNPNQLDHDGDGICDACEDDDDNDGIKDDVDNCQFDANPGQQDNEGDGKGDACDTDDDNDEVMDDKDNCPWHPNLFQDDLDQDGLGDVCDGDDDGDGVSDKDDNCPLVANENQLDLDEDGLGNKCDDDVDGDGVVNDEDNCLITPNPGQQNSDDDAQGDACDPDMDNDGDINTLDNCPTTPNPEQLDTDGDCPPTPYPAQVSCGDACDGDLDGDGIVNESDNCPGVPNPEQEDLNQDGIGDACTTDKDGDGVDDDVDNCPKSPNEDQANADNDALGDVCDADDDNDLVFDNVDNCPFVPNPGQEDANQNGIGDACEPD